jgi:hypothetical protein
MTESKLELENRRYTGTGDVSRVGHQRAAHCCVAHGGSLYTRSAFAAMLRVVVALAIALVLAIALITAVEAAEPSWSTGYQPSPRLPAGEHRIDLQLEIRADVHEACTVLGIRPDEAAGPEGRVEGCATWNELPRCRIIVPPDASDELIAHELKHCMLGRWHR